MAGAVAPRSAVLVPGMVWAAALMLAPLAGLGISAGSGTAGSGINGPALGEGSRTTAAPWLWGAGAVLLVLAFPWLLVRALDRRGDLRTSIARAGAGPVAIGAGALCFMLLRLILWLDGPRALAAVVFAMMVSFTLTLVLPRGSRPDWPALSLGAGVVMLPVLLWDAFPMPVGAAAGAAACVACAAGLLLMAPLGWTQRLASAAAGAAAGGGAFLLLHAVSG